MLKKYFIPTIFVIALNLIFFSSYYYISKISSYKDYGDVLIYCYYLLAFFITPHFVSYIFRRVFFSEITFISLILQVTAAILINKLNISVLEFVWIPILFNLSLIKFIQSSFKRNSLFLFQLIALFVLLFSIIAILTIEKRSNIDNIPQSDYLVHQSVINRIADGQLCIFPDNCSSGFTVKSYTSIYHEINASIFGIRHNINSFWLSADLFFPVFGGILLFLILKELKASRVSQMLAPIIVVLTFENGGYTFANLLPQTLTFYFFINTFFYILKTKQIPILFLIGTGILLFLSHFYIGIYLSAILIFVSLMTSAVKNKIVNPKLIYLILISGTLLAIALANKGLNLEKANLIVQNQNNLGTITNYPFPSNLDYLKDSTGLILILALVFSLKLFFSRNSKSNLQILLFVSFILIAISSFVIGPTYAHKFFLGISFFSTLVVCLITDQLIKREAIKPLIFAFLIYFQFQTYNTSYRNIENHYKGQQQEVSAVSQNDMKFIRNISNTEVNNCFVISDPTTQLNLNAFYLTQSVDGLYMNKLIRHKLHNFAENPNQKNWNDLIEDIEPYSNKYQTEQLCFVYTSKLKELVGTSADWKTNTLRFIFDSSTRVWTGDEVAKFLLYANSKPSRLIYADTKFLLFIYNI
jgi:hypothetical protein